MNRCISIIVCCYNSERRIPETLRHLASLETKDITTEVILVNNASTDGTARVAQDVWEECKSGIPLIAVDQSIPGLAAARSKGVAASKYEFLLFCDDDNWLDRNYLIYALECMVTRPDVAALGGISHPECESPPPKWCDELWGAYAVGRQARVSGEVWVLWGAGIVLRKSALLTLEQAGFNWLLSGRKGANLSSGEDHELCWALRLANFRLWYDERLQLQHFITKDRMVEEYIRRLFRSTAYCVIGLQPYQSVLERDIRSRTEVSPVIFWRKAARLFVELFKDTVRLTPLLAILRKDLPRELDFRRRLLTMWLLLTRTGELVENTRMVLAVRTRLDAARSDSMSFRTLNITNGHD